MPGGNRGRPNLAGSTMDGAPIEGGDNRAQTAIDFMIAVGVFMMVVGFVLGVIPGMIDPFSDSQETTLVADRLATQISEGMLAEPDEPTVLNETCVNAFFDQSLADGEDCPISFDETVTDLSERLGVREYHSINVTIERDIDGDGLLDLLATNGNDIGGTGSTNLAIGDTPSDTQSVVVAKRTAFVDGIDVQVIVRVW